MSSGSLARRYARAMMAIGVDSKNFEAMGDQIATLSQAMKISPELGETLSNPAFPRADRRKILAAILDRLSADKAVRNFTMLLLDRERIAALPDISRELSAMIDQHIGRVSARVTSATPLSADQLTHIKTMLEKLSGKQVQLESAEDPELLGGIVAKVGDIVYDGSLRTQLAQMRHSLAN
ncbi:MAG: ATP synthase F1 subunit delta [Myxococcota bacterium]